MRLTLTKEAEYALRALVWLAQTEAAQAAAPADGAGRSRGGDGDASASDVMGLNGVDGAPAVAIPPPRHKAATIARATGMPPVFALRVLAHLQREGLLSARAGQRGGYVLARPSGEISLLEAIEAVEGPLVSPECVLRDAGCGARGYCVLHDAWCAAQSALRTALAQTSLADAIAGQGVTVDAAQPPVVRRETQTEPATPPLNGHGSGAHPSPSQQ